MSAEAILPGATIGVLGSGQLGRMFAIAARQMGYRVHTLSPDTDTPTGQVADLEIVADYEDLDAIRAFAARVDVVTFEFENVPAGSAEACAAFVPVRPGGSALHTTQQRSREKAFLRERGMPVVPYARATDGDGLRAAIARIGLPCVVKSAAWGYDGLGQLRVSRPADVETAVARFAAQEVVVEKLVALAAEISVIAARDPQGVVATYPAFENRHANHILDTSLCPARVPVEILQRAAEIARAVLEALDYVGVLCVELFVTEDGALYVNELAPRPHNSGHLTIEACVTSQFEQQVRAVCGLPLGSTELLRPAAMANLLGDLWRGGEPDWLRSLEHPEAKLHVYGKSDARSGRKMGHLTSFGRDASDALERVVAARRAIARVASDSAAHGAPPLLYDERHER